jgi:phage baseplate assembly protein W
MTTGLAPLLPIESSRFELIQDYPTLVTQNLKMLILTSPGERMMDTNFGVGLKAYLFELNDETTYEEITSRIRSQVAQYMPFVEIQKVAFKTPENDPSLFPHDVHTIITYKILPLRMTGMLQIDTNTN